MSMEGEKSQVGYKSSPSVVRRTHTQVSREISKRELQLSKRGQHCFGIFPKPSEGTFPKNR